MKRIKNGVTIALGQQKERDQRCGAHGKWALATKVRDQKENNL